MERETFGQSKQTVFKVSGMDCGEEASAVQASLLSLMGVHRVEPNILNAKVVVTHTTEVRFEDLSERIRSTGVSIETTTGPRPSRFLNFRTVLVALSGAFLGAGLVADKFELLPPSARILPFLLASLLGGALVVPKALRSLKALRLDMNILMCVATLGAFAIGEYAEGAAVVFLFSLAEWLESLSLERARRAIQSLLKLVPETAFLKTETGPREVPVSEVKMDEVILIRSGSRIALDGVVVEGTSAVNQAPLTGESLPVDKKAGDRVLAGSINGEGSLEVRVTKTHENTKLAQIITLVEEAEKQRAPTQRFVDTFAKYYTPCVLVLAALVLVVPPLMLGGDWQTWLYRSLVLLVIACPCALVIATPVSIVSGLTSMARKGVLIKGGAGLETVGRLRALAVDKTGTITEGVPRLLKVVSFNAKSETEILAIAASIDQHSPHPLARAVVEEARRRQVSIPATRGYQSVTGRGAEAIINDHFFFVGNHRFAHENAICSPELEKTLESLEEKAMSVVVVGHRPHLGCTGEIFGVLGLGDAIRSDAAEAIRDLHAMGIQSVLMLSGDNQRTVDAIARQVGIDEAYGDLLPTDKVLKIKELKDRFTEIAMIGDGVNDAPAMASASLGIAMGASGTDTAIEAADMTLMQDKLSGVVEAIRMGKRTLRVMRFNTAFALATKLLFLALSVWGFSSLWLAIAADTGATLLVIANALRLLR